VGRKNCNANGVDKKQLARKKEGKQVAIEKSKKRNKRR
jgi:hypothetical protein